MFSLQGRKVPTPTDRLGKYELLGRLAVGGMAEIFLARAAGIEGFEKVAVLKRILPQYAENQSFVSMFLEEARLAATLNHPNIAHVYDIGVVNGSYFFTMEYIHGEDLRSIVRALAKLKRGLPIEHALSIVAGVAAGLHYAHEKVGPDGRALGIVHRDVSPSNIIVTFDGGVKVLDFGIAKATKKYTQNQAATLKGKVSYMSPEQTRGEQVDRRADVFAIGILLYELTTGTRLYPGESESAVIHRIVHDDAPPPSTRAPGYPPDLERIVLKALQRRPEDRWQSAKELQAAIEDFASEHRIRISSLGLEALMRELFGRKIDAWQAAQAQGKSLTEHLASTVMRDLAGSESEEQSITRSFTGSTSPRSITSPDQNTLRVPAPPRESAGGRWIIAAIVVLALGLAGVGAGWYLLFERRAGPSAPKATPSAPAPPAAGAGPIVEELPGETSPPGAEPEAVKAPPLPVNVQRPAKKKPDVQKHIGVTGEDSPFEAE